MAIVSEAMPLDLLGAEVREAFASRDVARLALLLDDDVTWGVAGHPRSCRGRDEVAATFSRVLAEGTDGELLSLRIGSDGLVCEIDVHEMGDEHSRRLVFQLFTVRDGRIVDIRPFDNIRQVELVAGPTRLLSGI